MVVYNYPAVGVISDAFLTGVVSFLITFPLMRSTFVGSEEFEVTVTDLLIGPNRSVAYLTLISALSPGLIGFLGHVGTVHPHEPLAREIIKGAFPVLSLIHI